MPRIEDKVVVILLFLVVFNFGFWWMGSLGFFDTGIEGSVIEYDVSKYGLDNLLVDGFLVLGLGLMAGIASAFLRINAFACIMFTEIFWMPFMKTVSVFNSILSSVPVAFLGLVGIFTTLMLFMYAYTLIKLSQTAGAF